MKLLALSNLYPPNVIGGYEVLCYDMMRALAQRGHEIQVLTSDYGGQQAEFEGRQVDRRLKLPATDGNIYVPFTAGPEQRQRINQHNLDCLQQSLKEHGPELLFVWNLHFFDQSLLEAIAATRLPVVYLLTDNWLAAARNPGFISHYFATEVHGPGQSPGQRCKTWLKRLLRPAPGPARITGTAIFPSRFMVELYRRAGLEFARSRVVPHGIPGQPADSPHPAEEQGPLHAGVLKLLFAGRIVDVKGVDTAIDALPLLCRQRPELNFQLTIIGNDQDAAYKQQLDRRIREQGMTQRVRFAPAVKEEALPELFRAHDVYLFPSRYEPFSLTLIHALRSGIPTVASRAGGNPELITHGRTGLLFRTGSTEDLVQQVMRLATDAQLAATVSRQGRLHAAAFSFAAMVERIEEILRSSFEEGP